MSVYEAVLKDDELPRMYLSLVSRQVVVDQGLREGDVQTPEQASALIPLTAVYRRRE